MTKEIERIKLLYDHYKQKIHIETWFFVTFSAILFSLIMQTKREGFGYFIIYVILTVSYLYTVSLLRKKQKKETIDRLK